MRGMTLLPIAPPIREKQMTKQLNLDWQAWLAAVLVSVVLFGCGGTDDEPECAKDDPICRCVVNGTQGSCK